MSRISNSSRNRNARTKAPPSYAHVNKNFLNYPLARDAHIQPRWRASHPTGKWWLTELADNDRIQFQLPKEVAPEFKHTPTGFDFNVLMLLIGAAQAAKSHQIVFASYAAVLKRLDLPISHHYRQQLRDSLSYWCELSIRYTCWHKQGQKQQVTRRLPPAVEKIEVDRAIHITLQLQWTGLTEGGYWTRLQLPLPMQAAAQNLVLALKCSLVKYAGSDIGQVLEPRKLHSLAGTIGLTHNTRRRQFNRLLSGPVTSYFEAAGRQFMANRLPDGSVQFSILVPPSPEPSTSPPEPQSVPRVRLRRHRPEPLELPIRVPTYDDAGGMQMMWQVPPDGEWMPVLPKRWQKIMGYADG